MLDLIFNCGDQLLLFLGAPTRVDRPPPLKCRPRVPAHARSPCTSNEPVVVLPLSRAAPKTPDHLATTRISGHDSVPASTRGLRHAGSPVRMPVA